MELPCEKIERARNKVKEAEKASIFYNLKARVDGLDHLTIRKIPLKELNSSLLKVKQRKFRNILEK